MHIKNDLAISLLGIYPRKIIIYEHQATNPKEMLIMALFMIAENRNNPILFKEEKLISIVIECNVIQQSEWIKFWKFISIDLSQIQNTERKKQVEEWYVQYNTTYVHF